LIDTDKVGLSPPDAVPDFAIRQLPQHRSRV